MDKTLLLTDHVIESARGHGFELVGVCDATPPQSYSLFQEWLKDGKHGTMGYLERNQEIRSDPKSLLPGVRSIVAVGLNYNQDPTSDTEGPRIARYALGRDYHKTLRGKLRSVQKVIEDSQPGTLCRICVDSAPILEREFAMRAGLGWFGKNTCLINSHRGSWFFIGLLLTTAELQPSSPAVGGCGTCQICIDACPTGAIVLDQDRWQIDSRRCVSYLTIEHRGEIDPDLVKGIGDWTYGCDVCQDVCPFNKARPGQPLRASRTGEPDFRRLRTWPKLEVLANLDWNEWAEATRGSAVRRTGLEGLRRNARLNLANKREPR